MDQNRTPISPEVDDSQNPTAAAPFAPEATELGTTSNPVSAAAAGTADVKSYGHPDTGTGAAAPGEWGTESTAQAWQPVTDEASSGSAGLASHPMVSQLQNILDNLTTQARPVLREVAAKAAELAAAAGEKAGPLAHRAAEAAESAGERFASKSKEVAEDLRRAGSEGSASGTEGDSSGVQPVSGGFAEGGAYGTSSSYGMDPQAPTGDPDERPPTQPASGI